MRPFTPLRLISIAAILLLLGAVLPFLMVIGILEPSFALSFFSYASSLVGLILGLFGIAQHGRNR